MKRVCSEHVCEKSTNTTHSLGMLVNLHDHYLGPSAHQSERNFQKAIYLYMKEMQCGLALGFDLGKKDDKRLIKVFLLIMCPFHKVFSLAK